MSRMHAKDRLGEFMATAMASNVDAESRERWVSRLERSIGWGG